MSAVTTSETESFSY